MTLKYPGTTEIVPGVFVGTGDVFIADTQGEVVTWTAEEVLDDPEVLGVILAAVILATKQGPEAVRANIVDKGSTLRDLIHDTELEQWRKQRKRVRGRKQQWD